MLQPVNLSTVTGILDNAALDFIYQQANYTSLMDSARKSLRMASTRKTRHLHQVSTSPTPWFIYYAMPHMHAPMAHAARFTNSSTSKTAYGDTLREMDNSVKLMKLCAHVFFHVSFYIYNFLVLFFFVLCVYEGWCVNRGVEFDWFSQQHFCDLHK